MTRFLAILAFGVLASGCGARVVTPPDAVADDINQLLTPDATGWVDKSKTGATGIQGRWHAFDDGRFGVRGVTPGNCLTAKYGECSVVREPARDSPYAPTPGLGMCTSGVIARWIAGSDGVTPDGSPGWAGIVLDLNTPDWPEPRAVMNAPTGQLYDADTHGVTGFAFDIDSEPAPGAAFRVEIATVGPKRPPPDSSPAYWGGTRLDGSPVHAGHNEFAWNDVGPGSFYPNGMLHLGFLVSGNDSHAISYNFCINHLTALRSSGAPPVGDPSINDQHLVPNENGYVARSSTGKTGIQGQWFVAADSIGDPPNCRESVDLKCSIVNEPNPPPATLPPIFAPTMDLGMCTSGIVAKSVDDSGTVWGAMIGFTLNAADWPEVRLETYDAERYGVTGFAFDIDSEPAPGAEIQVEVPTFKTQNTAAWWGGRDVPGPSPVHAGHNEFRWKDVGGPWWIPDRPMFEWRDLVSVAFHVNPNKDHPVRYRFCIKNLTALRH